MTRRASLEVLRAEAQDERETMIYARARNGEDPWRFMQELPTVDELVVLLMRAEALERGGDEAPESGAHDAQLMRRIATEYPPLSTTVWTMLAGESRFGDRWSA
ncbi:tryptophan synthase subunit alpha [Pseudoclavibacter terrae]|uniref:Tryptophan synthase subunit alpha n=1 Tax=Pseudoclavibacter terrae TaxID=1530195 RepID=A0A7J5B0R8_9MICO|nr:tryptophan synthase subunit alpha [Pseudoclavibacter terrae]MBS3178713.1 tryptophan synthase subunit alpha [Pseudoclavibacter sp. Marseille-Q4354]PPG27745.1 tryptophan synthase subunit alpha [Pseudoclavibacter sp. RFBB5]PPG42345.1 tryptophan synthase subunit alpha [Pseudoclavibacter sp. RFBA6]